MYLYGASGHAKVILEILELMQIPVNGLFDDNSDIHSILGYPVMQFQEADIQEIDKLIISIGLNKRRMEIAARLHVPFGYAIHPNASISTRSEIGIGSVIMAGVTLNSSTCIGKHSIINTNASVDHDCIVGDFVHISPNVTLCGGVTVDEGTHIGAGTVIIPGVKIGKWSIIGAGSVIIHDVPDNVTIVGNPGRDIHQ